MLKCRTFPLQSYWIKVFKKGIKCATDAKTKKYFNIFTTDLIKSMLNQKSGSERIKPRLLTWPGRSNIMLVTSLLGSSSHFLSVPLNVQACPPIWAIVLMVLSARKAFLLDISQLLSRQRSAPQSQPSWSQSLQLVLFSSLSLPLPEMILSPISLCVCFLTLL